jgi:hypothetical protein
MEQEASGIPLMSHEEFKSFMQDLANGDKLIYLASPYNHEDMDIMSSRYYDAVRATASLMHIGLVVYSPIMHNHLIAVSADLGRGWEYWERYDRIHLSRCDVLFILNIPGVWDSVGVKAETEIAFSMGKPIFKVNPDRYYGYTIDQYLYQPNPKLEEEWRIRNITLPYIHLPSQVVSRHKLRFT